MSCKPIGLAFSPIAPSQNLTDLATNASTGIGTTTWTCSVSSSKCSPAVGITSNDTIQEKRSTKTNAFPPYRPLTNEIVHFISIFHSLIMFYKIKVIGSIQKSPFKSDVYSFMCFTNFSINFLIFRCCALG